MSDLQSHSLSPRWQKAQAIAVILASLAIPVVVAIVGSVYTTKQKDQELAVRYVELAVAMLRAEPTKQTATLRTWAVSIVDHFSPVPLPADAKINLQLDQLLVEMQATSEESRRLHEEAMKAVKSLR